MLTVLVEGVSTKMLKSPRMSFQSLQVGDVWEEGGNCQGAMIQAWNYQGGNCPGVNFLGVIFREPIIQG